MTAEADLAAWAKSVRVDHGTVTPSEDGISIVLDGDGPIPVVRLLPPPAGTSPVVARIDALLVQQVNILSEETQGIDVLLTGGERLERVNVDGALRALSIVKPRGAVTYLGKGTVGDLTLHGGAYSLERGHVHTLVAIDCEVSRPNNAPDIQRVEARGSVFFGGSGWRIPLLDLSEASEISVDPNKPLVAQEVLLPPGESALTLSGHFQFGHEARPELRIEGGTISFADEAELTIKGHADGVSFIGSGLVTIHDELVSGRFSAGVRVQCAGVARLLEARGTIKLLECGKAVVTGAITEPLRPLSISRAKGAVLLNIDCFGLDEQSLDAIQESAQFAPWVPSQSWRAVRKLQSMSLSTRENDSGGVRRVTDSATEKWRRARFWQRVTRLTADSHASGDTQSRVRFVYTAARRYASESRRERFLLWVYSFIGYGERVMRPLGLYAVAAASVWLGLTYGPLSVDGGPSFGDVIGLPLKFFRIVGKDSADSVDGGLRWVLASLQLFGLLMLFFSLSAIRRVSKAE